MQASLNGASDLMSTYIFFWVELVWRKCLFIFHFVIWSNRNNKGWGEKISSCFKNSFSVNYLFVWGWLLKVFLFNKVPYLLELKKLPSVLFAGIDRPDDVVNLTHQELFAKGGFIVCDELALDTLTLGTDQVATQIMHVVLLLHYGIFIWLILSNLFEDDMKKVVGILEELDKQGKWKWFLHYRDSRRLRENARYQKSFAPPLDVWAFKDWSSLCLYKSYD